MKNFGDLNTWTKTDLARVIAQALTGADKPLPADHFRVKRIVRANRHADLVRNGQMAIETISRRKVAQLESRKHG